MSRFSPGNMLFPTPWLAVPETIHAILWARARKGLGAMSPRGQGYCALRVELMPGKPCPVEYWVLDQLLVAVVLH